jgi:hypothetical protein
MAKDHEPPKFLFKYRSLACDTHLQRVREIITTCQIYYPAPDQINDPFDCKMPPVESFDPYWARYRIAARNATNDDERFEVGQRFEAPMIGKRTELEKLKEPLSPAEKNDFDKILSHEIEPKLNTTGVLSPSAVGDNTLMWSHYADSHRGICLQFCLDNWPDLEKSALAVDYPRERPLLKLDDKSLREGAAVKAMALCKDPLWVYECEWRSLAPISGRHDFPEARPHWLA